MLDFEQMFWLFVIQFLVASKKRVQSPKCEKQFFVFAEGRTSVKPIGDIFSKILGEPMVNRCPEDNFAFVMPLNL